MMNRECILQPRNRVVAICNNSHNEILFLKNQEDGNTNTMSLPGDFVRYGELAEEALRRSIFQQTKLCVEPFEILGIYSSIDNPDGLHIIESVFVCIITNFSDMGMKTGSARHMWLDWGAN